MDQMCLCVPEALASKTFGLVTFKSWGPFAISCPPLCWTKNWKNPGFLKECNFHLNASQSPGECPVRTHERKYKMQVLQQPHTRWPMLSQPFPGGVTPETGAAIS